MVVKLKFDSNLDFQREAIDSIVDLFNGQIKQSFDFTFQIRPNILTISHDEILTNLLEIRKRNGMPEIDDLIFSEAENLNQIYQFTIEMETGTGKTYVYLRAILELYQKFGFKKFIIVAPSVAIKEGIIKTFDITKDHFRELYENIPYNFFIYSSANLAQIRMFAQDTNLQIMIITRDAFNKDINIIHNVNDRMGDKPIELIKQTNPIVILDEPQKMGGVASEWGISELNPLFILRFSATHKEVFNQVFNLTPPDAYEQGLVKKIEVLSITEEGDPSNKKIILEKINSLKSGLRGKVKVFVKETTSVKFKPKTLKNGDDLARITNNSYYDGFIVSEINKSSGYITFTNGIKIYEGKSSVKEDEITRIMVREAINEHLEKKRKLNPQNVKILSLFFINRVDDYLPKDSILKKIFEEEFIKLTNSSFTIFKNINPKNIHKGYFSVMRNLKSIERDEDAYNLIMKDKERLLSIDEPVEFIFSHSALREGWDNPNVFVICTLSYSTSEIKKRQEIGRGLRLPVDSNGNRIHDREKNILTVITNETYQDYVEQLQSEFREEGLLAPPPPENRGKRKILSISKDIFESESFKILWEKISKKAKYTVNINRDDFVKNCCKEINEISDIKAPEISIKKIGITELGQEISDEYLSVKSEKVSPTKVFNIVKYIENETGLTKSTILDIVETAENFNLFFLNPQKYTEKIIGIIKHKLKLSSVENIQYIEFEEHFDVNLFSREFQTYEKYIVPLKNEKTLYMIKGEKNNAVSIDSIVESNFAKELDRDSRIKLFIKLPEWFKIATPVGKYTPDWAILVEKPVNGTKKQSIYFVVETKGSNDINDLRLDEQMKIKSAKKRFELLENVKFEAPVKDFSTFEEKI